VTALAFACYAFLFLLFVSNPGLTIEAGANTALTPGATSAMPDRVAAPARFTAESAEEVDGRQVELDLAYELGEVQLLGRHGDHGCVT